MLIFMTVFFMLTTERMTPPLAWGGGGNRQGPGLRTSQQGRSSCKRKEHQWWPGGEVAMGRGQGQNTGQQGGGICKRGFHVAHKVDDTAVGLGGGGDNGQQQSQGRMNNRQEGSTGSVQGFGRSQPLSNPHPALVPSSGCTCKGFPGATTPASAWPDVPPVSL